MIRKYSGKWGEYEFLHRVVSFYPNHTSSEATPTEIGAFLCDYPDEVAADISEARTIAMQIAACNDEAKRDTLTDRKKRSKQRAACITPCACFASSRAGSAEHTPSGLLCVDLDRKDNPHIKQETWERLPDLLQASRLGKYIAFIGESRSGWAYGGYFLLIPVTGVDDWQRRYMAVHNYLQQAGLIVDKNAGSFSHCRAVSRQERTDLPRLHNAQPFAGKAAQPKKKQPLPIRYAEQGESQYLRAARCCEYIQRNRINLTDDFAEWTEIAFALATFGERGEALFYAIAAQSPKYKETENARKWQNVLKTANGNVRINTFWYYAKRAGINVKDFH